MTDKPISVGDLVMVVRWPHGCINPVIPLGKPFVVAQFRVSSGKCAKCGRFIHNPGRRSALGATSDGAGIPLSWLKRIPPLDELEGASLAEGDLAEQRRIHDQWAQKKVSA